MQPLTGKADRGDSFKMQKKKEDIVEVPEHDADSEKTMCYGREERL